MGLRLIALLLCGASVVMARIAYIEESYEVDAEAGEFNHMVIHKTTGAIYIGAVNHLYKFDKDLNMIIMDVTGPKLDNPDCSPRIFTQECDKKEVDTNSYNKALVIDYTEKKLLYCISLFQGICEKRDLDEIKEVEKPTVYLPIVANNATATTYMFIAPGSRAGETNATSSTIYVGVSSTNNGNSRHHVPAFASRKLKDFDLVYKDLSAKSQVTIDPIRSMTFPVYYIYGFSSKGFSYMLSVQKQNPSTPFYITKLIRVCQGDIKFYSYAEVGLECHQDGMLYNLLQAAYVSKAGNNLAVKLGIPPNEDVLYGVFSRGKPNGSATPGQSSALCVYPLRNIIRMFTENIKDCFEGTGNTGPAHLRSPIACVKTPTLEISDDYCGKYDVNSPIDGPRPIKAEAAATFNYTVSAVTVSIVTNYTVALVGTSSGHLIKVALETQTKGKVYEDVTLFEGHRINADMYVSNEKQHLYMMTDRKLLKVKLYECSQYTNCATCLGASNPYCGWCSLENKCSQRQECQHYDEKLRWLAYSGGNCTNITNVEPSKIQVEKEKTTSLDLNVTNLPSFKGKYQCVFSSGKTRITTTSTTIDQSNVIRCETPKTNLLPAWPTGKDHIVMALAVQIGGLDFVSTNFTFFDCSIHISCTKCTLSEFPCTWCINNHKCTHDVDTHCEENVIVHGRNSVEKAQPIGPEMCPRIELQDSTTDNKILVPSGIQKRITVKAINLQDFQMSLIRCYFAMDGRPEVSAVINTTSHTIECAINDFSYSEPTPMMNVPFTVYANTNPLDNPEKIQGNATVEPISIIMFKCAAMADTCGDCISRSLKVYKCGWCDGVCNIQSECRSRNTWLSSNGTCPNVQITEIMPLTGPKAGGTKLTIIGKNLGKQFSDINGRVTVAGVACNAIEEEYEPPRRIVCQTGSHSIIATGIVSVEIGNMYTAMAKQRFSYVQPYLANVHPINGPMSGGTKITITGRHLNAGTSAEVKIGIFTCTVLQRRNNSMVCRTGRAVCPKVDGEVDRNCSMKEEISAKVDDEHVSSSLIYEYIADPEIRTVQPLRGIVSGGILIQVTGTNLNSIQDAYMVMEELEEGRHRRRRRRRRRNTSSRYTSDCKVPKPGSKDMYCYSPQISNSTVSPDSVSGVKFAYSFQLDGVSIERKDTFTIYPDPVFEEFAGNREKSYQSKTDNYLTINGKNLNLGFNSSDVKVRVGTDFCNVTSIDKHGNQLNCKPPRTQPNSAQGNKYPEVMVEVGRNFTKLIGYLKYEKTEILPLPVIIGLGTGGGLLILVVIFFVVLWCIKTRENTSMKKKWQIQMDNLEVKVAKECKEAFAELQTDMTELTSDHFGQIAIPFWDYRTYCMRVLFPQEDDSYAVIREVEVDTARRDDVERGLTMFSQLMGNKTFLLMFVRTLESNKKFSMRDRVNVASLISVALQTRMEYATEILKTLLAELIAKSVEGKNHPKLLLRRTESIAEKMLSNWFTFLLYKFLRECAGEPLFMLYQAIKQQTSKGPVDSITSEARYSLSEDKLIRQQIDYKPITIYVQDMEQFGQQSHPVKVLDCDTITQVKEKILDAIYKNAPFSSRPVKANVDLVLLDKFKNDEAEVPLIRKSILSDVDASTKHDGEFRRFNTLAHYQVNDGAAMALVLKQSASICDLSTSSDKSMGNKGFDYRRFGTGKDDVSGVYSGRSPSLNRTASPQNVQIDVENTSNGVKYFHLVKQQQDVQTGQEQTEVKMVSEIYLTRLLATKGTLQQFVDDLFERIFSTVHRGTSLPLAIKYMFDFLDDQALQHNMQDLDIVHTWKSNSLPLRFWVNVIKNPNFVFDIYKSNIVDSCLSVVAQNFMDSCSMSEHKLGKDSPSSKLLYAKDIPTYRKWVDRYYQDIKMMPAISDQDMTAMMAEESRSHQEEFNSNAALYELYKYVNQYYDDLSAALDEDVFARQSKLCHKLEQVHVAMNGEAYC